jgi:hypothetical protein
MHKQLFCISKNMSNLRFELLLLLCLCNACSNRQVLPGGKAAEKQFSYFEMSYRGGWIGGFSFCLDSNRQFFSPSLYLIHPGDSIKYGVLPDTLQQKIDTLVALLEKDTALHSRYHPCDDCSSVAIKVATPGDTIRVFQTGEISAPLLAVILELDSFLLRPHQKHAPAPMYLETAEKVAPPPPPPILSRQKNPAANKK